MNITKTTEPRPFGYAGPKSGASPLTPRRYL